MNKLCLAINAEESASVMAVIPRSVSSLQYDRCPIRIKSSRTPSPPLALVSQIVDHVDGASLSCFQDVHELSMTSPCVLSIWTCQ